MSKNIVASRWMLLSSKLCVLCVCFCTVLVEYRWRWSVLCVLMCSRIRCCCQAVDTLCARLVPSSWLRTPTFCVAQNADLCTSCVAECAAYRRTLLCSGLLKNVNGHHRVVDWCVRLIQMTPCHCIVRLVKRQFASSVTSQIHFAKARLCIQDTRLTLQRMRSRKKR